jgi:hypothetical protein
MISLADLAFFFFDHLRVLIFHGLEELKTGLQVFDLGGKLGYRTSLAPNELVQSIAYALSLSNHINNPLQCEALKSW